MSAKAEAQVLKIFRDAVETVKAPAATLSTKLPRLGELWEGQGGYFAGIARDETGGPDYALVSAPETLGELTWNDAMKRSKAFAFEGHSDYSIPTLSELQICRSNVRHRYPGGWFWSSTQTGAFNAHSQSFEYGYSPWDTKDCKFHACVVRRVSLTNSVI